MSHSEPISAFLDQLIKNRVQLCISHRHFTRNRLCSILPSLLSISKEYDYGEIVKSLSFLEMPAYFMYLLAAVRGKHREANPTRKSIVGGYDLLTIKEILRRKSIESSMLYMHLTSYQAVLKD